MKLEYGHAPLPGNESSLIFAGCQEGWAAQKGSPFGASWGSPEQGAHDGSGAVTTKLELPTFQAKPTWTYIDILSNPAQPYSNRQKDAPISLTLTNQNPLFEFKKSGALVETQDSRAHVLWTPMKGTRHVGLHVRNPPKTWVLVVFRYKNPTNWMPHSNSPRILHHTRSRKSKDMQSSPSGD